MRQPLTILLLAATALIDLIGATDRGRLSPWSLYPIHGLLVGQGFVLGGWLALGAMHRLGRAAASLAICATLAAMMVVIRHGEFDEFTAVAWGRYLGTFVVIGGGTAVAARLYRTLRRRFLAKNLRGEHRPFRYPVVELLGWMVVVAVASTAARHLQTSHLAGPPGQLALLIACVVVAATAMVEFDPREPLRKGGSSAAALMGAFALAAMALCVAARRLPSSEQAAWVVGVACCYVASWVAVRRLDASTRHERSSRDSYEDDFVDAHAGNHPASRHMDAALWQSPVTGQLSQYE